MPWKRAWSRKEKHLCLGGLAVLFLLLLSIEKELRLAGEMFGSVMKESITQEVETSLYQSFLPSLSFVQEKERDGSLIADSQITEIMPLYGYALEQRKEEMAEDAFLSLEDIRLAEAEEANGADTDGQDGDAETDCGTASLPELVPAEAEVLLQEDGLLQETQTAFVPHTLQTQVNREVLKDYETLVKQFYTIDSNTMAGSDQLDFSKLLGRDMSVTKREDGPQILIYHTHSQEAFADSVAGDEEDTIVGVGDRLAEILTEEYGYQVLHHKGQYDVETRDDAYSKSLPEIEQILKDNPTIEVVIDLHRDQMPEETRLVMDLDGRPTARFMFFNGLSRTQKTGDISYLYNENISDNLAFSFQMQLKAAEYYPGLTRKIYLKGYRYNMHLKPKTLLIELGAQNNTVEEAMNACDPLAHILDMVLSGE